MRLRSSVSISGDAVVVRAYQDDDKGSEGGSGYVYTRTNTAWSVERNLPALDGAAGDNFGCSVSVSGDTLVVGAYQDDDKGSSSGSAYVHTLTRSDWKFDR